MGTPMTRTSRRASWRPLVALAALATIAAACDRSEEGLREWSPQDHDHQTTPSAGQVDASQQRPALEEHGISDVILASWKQNCVTCHGPVGRGDGPQGPMVRPPDFTNPVWQKNAMDDHMRRTITKGRGAMPGFAHLPEETVDGLIRLIRLLNRDRPAPAAAAPAAAAPAAAPPAAAPPTTATPPAATSPATPPPAAAPNPASPASTPAAPATAAPAAPEQP